MQRARIWLGGCVSAVVLGIAAAAGADLSSYAETKLLASDAAQSDQFGFSVSVSGDTAVVGAIWDDDGVSQAGSAYVFMRDAGGADTWGEVAKLTATEPGGWLGFSVSVSGDTAVVGAIFNDSTGSAYVFMRDAGGADAWGQVAKLEASDPAFEDFFGYSVSVSGDTAVVGAYYDDDAGEESGSAYVFQRDAGGPDNWGQVAKLTASDAAAGDQFGTAVSISGDTAVVGAIFDDHAGNESGSAYVFERDAGGPDNWGQVAKLTASDAAGDIFFGDVFGISVSLSGDTAVVGASGNADAGTNSGSAYVFERDAGGPDAWGEVAKLTASDAGRSDRFGDSVSVSGDVAVIGAYRDDDMGSAYVFVRNVGGPDSWGEVAKLTASDAAGFGGFGDSVSASGDTILAGNPVDDEAGVLSGSAYVFDLIPICSNGVVETGEACDDGNADDGDGCSSECTLEAVDHYMFYRTKAAKGTPGFVRMGPVLLSDLFGAHEYQIRGLKQLGLPADKNDEGVGDDVTHLAEYRVRAVRGTPEFETMTDVRVINQCHDVLVEVEEPRSVLVPSLESHDAPVPAPDVESHRLDHFLCYRAEAQEELSDGTELPELPKGTQVVVEDQFQTRRYDLKKITKLCNPAAKSGSPAILAGRDKGTPMPLEPAEIRRPDQHLVCYRAKIARKNIPQDGCGCDTELDPRCKGVKLDPHQAKHEKLEGLHINNQLGPLELDSIKEFELCLPSETILP